MSDLPVDGWSMERVQQRLGLGRGYENDAKQIDCYYALEDNLAAEKSTEVGDASRSSSKLSSYTQPATASNQILSVPELLTMIDGAEICLESRLGAGHFGEAWLASFHGADVVVKRLKAAPSIDVLKVRPPAS